MQARIYCRDAYLLIDVTKLQQCQAQRCFSGARQDACVMHVLFRKQMYRVVYMNHGNCLVERV